MLPIDHHVQNTLYKFNREMKRLNQGDSTFAGWAAIRVAKQDLEYQHIESDTNKTPVDQIRYTS